MTRTERDRESECLEPFVITLTVSYSVSLPLAYRAAAAPPHVLNKLKMSAEMSRKHNHCNETIVALALALQYNPPSRTF